MFDSVAQLKRRIKEEIKRLQRRRLIPRFLGGPTPAITATFAGHAKDENVGELLPLSMESVQSMCIKL